MKTRKIVIISVILSILSLSLMTGCQKSNQETQTDSSFTFQDSLGNTITLTESPKRVVALMGSYGQVWTLAGGKLVGVTSDVTEENRFELSNDTEIIGSVKEPNTEKIISLNPDFVILSADIATHPDVATLLQNAGIPCAFFKVESFDDYLNMLNIFTDLTGNKDLYQKYGLDIQCKIKDIISSVDSNIKPKVLLLRAFSTGVKAKGNDSIAGKIISDLGAINIADTNTSLLDDLSLEVILQEDPDYIFVVPMGSDTEKAVESIQSMMLSNPAWNTLKAVKNNQLFYLEKELFHFKPNDKWGEAYETLRKILYP